MMVLCNLYIIIVLTKVLFYFSPTIQFYQLRFYIIIAGYGFWNILGVWLYNLTPLVVYLYHFVQDVPSPLGFIWHLTYPFDETRPIYRELLFIFEAYAGNK